MNTVKQMKVNIANTELQTLIINYLNSKFKTDAFDRAAISFAVTKTAEYSAYGSVDHVEVLVSKTEAIVMDNIHTKPESEKLKSIDDIIIDLDP